MELNHRRLALQANALPTELSPHKKCIGILPLTSIIPIPK